MNGNNVLGLLTLEMDSYECRMILSRLGERKILRDAARLPSSKLISYDYRVSLNLPSQRKTMTDATKLL